MKSHLSQNIATSSLWHQIVKNRLVSEDACIINAEIYPGVTCNLNVLFELAASLIKLKILLFVIAGRGT